MELKGEIAKYIDHTLLAPDATEERIDKLCEEAIKYKFASVCVNSCHVKYCAQKLKGTGVKVCCVVGFPLGAMASGVKAYEAAVAVGDGADEIDMVINVGYLKDNDDDLVKRDIRKVKRACRGRLLKVIIETCLLTEEEKVRACQLAVKAKADYVKTSTGFSKGGATAEDVALMAKTVGNRAKVKAAGGIRDLETALRMIDAGASRIGASAGIAIVEASKQ